MTYQREGNDPTRSHEYPTPDEVKAMITGGGNDDAPDRTTSGTPAEVLSEVMVWLTGERSLDESRAIARPEGRCATCGRKFDCCCQGCPTCPQIKMAAGRISASWVKRQSALGDLDPRS